MAKTKLKRKTTESRFRGNTTRKRAASTAAPRLKGKALEQAVEQFQAEPDDKKAHAQWKQIEPSVFGAQFWD
jgi:hypothetical protein